MTAETKEDRAKGVSELLRSAALSLKARDYAECERHCAKAIELLDRAKAGDHPSACMAMEFMGDCLIGMERYQEAAMFYTTGMEMADRLFGQENQVYISLLYKLAKSYESLSLLEECDPLYKNASDLARQHLSPEHPLRETITDGYAHLIKRRQKRKDKVVEIMDSFRTTRDKVGTLRPGASQHLELGEEELTDEEVETQGERARRKGSASETGLRSLRTIETETEKASNMLQYGIAAAALGVVACLVFLAWQYFNRPTAVNPSSTTAATTGTGTKSASPSIDVGAIKKTYTSLDGTKTVKIGENGAILEWGGAEVSAELFRPTAWNSDPAANSKAAVKYTFTESPIGLTDSEGTTLYAEGSPELTIKANMLSIASRLQRMYMLRGSFPQSADALRESGIDYKNPITGAIEVPIIQSDKNEQGWNPNNPFEKSAYEMSFEQGNLWQKEPPLLPGAIHCYVLCKREQKENTIVSNPIFKGSIVFIHAGDRNGNLLLNADKKTFLIVLKPGTRTITASSPQPLNSETSTAVIIKPRG